MTMKIKQVDPTNKRESINGVLPLKEFFQKQSFKDKGIWGAKHPLGMTYFTKGDQKNISFSELISIYEDLYGPLG